MTTSLIPIHHRVDVVCSYRAPLKARLIAEAAVPLVRLLRGRGYLVHLERHWLHGPHLRFCLSAGDGSYGGGSPGSEADLRAVAAELTGFLVDWLAEHPSEVDFDEAGFLAESEVLGRAELIAGPYGPLRPDNAVTVEQHDLGSLAKLLGSAGAVRCRATLLERAADVVAVTADWLVAAGNTPGARLELALTALTSHATAFPLGGLDGGYQSFLSHLEDFLLHHDQAGRMRRLFDAQWERSQSDVVTLVREVSGAEPNALARAWRAWSTEATEVAGESYQAGELPALPGAEYTARAAATGDDEVARRWDPARRAEYSAFHAAQRRLDFAALPYEREFVTYRFCTNVLYQLLVLLDVAPAERLLASSLLSSAVERITGRTWQDRLDEYVAWQGGVR